MEFNIDDFFDGYKAGKWRAVYLQDCRKEGKEFLAGRGKNSQGKDVFDVLEQIKRMEDESYKTRSGQVGLLTYQVLHPVKSYRDSRDIGNIIVNEARHV